MDGVFYRIDSDRISLDLHIPELRTLCREIIVLRIFLLHRLNTFERLGASSMNIPRAPTV